MIRALWREARPHQWAKNLLVFAAPGALGVLDESGPLARSFVIFVAFCLVSSGTYYWNDIRDREQDRRHPQKMHRPIASGAVPLGVASVVGSLLLVSGPIVAFAVRPQAGAVLLAYAILTLGYSTLGKYVPLLDLALVASGFVLRATAGATGTETAMSSWFILCTMFGSFFIVTGKRYSELAELGDGAGGTRPVLLAYTVQFLRQVLVISCTATLVSYCLWALENASSAQHSVPLDALSIAPMSLALLRYLMVVESGGGGAPEEVFIRDRAMQVYGLIWLIVYGLAVYTN